jgi:glycosyltransferase involved in cell wall biosynthesis
MCEAAQAVSSGTNQATMMVVREPSSMGLDRFASASRRRLHHAPWLSAQLRLPPGNDLRSAFLRREPPLEHLAERSPAPAGDPLLGAVPEATRMPEAAGRREKAGGHDPRPKVSVAIVTYNHRAFIAQAVESVLRQETPFDTEVVIGEDCSTDGTREILEFYAHRDDRIRLLLHPHRLGPDQPHLGGKYNFLATYEACRGEYVAFLEGDDYWTDTAKLRKQVELLDAYPGYAFCCHPVTVEYDATRVRHWPTVAGTTERSSYTLEDILRLETKPEMPMVSMMIRSELLRDFPPWFRGVANGDYAVQVLLARHGDIAFLPDCMAVHRKHAAGRSRMYDEAPDLANRMLLKLHIAINEELGFRFRAILDPYIEHESQIAAVADLFDTIRDSPPSRVVTVALEELATSNGSSLTLEHGTTVVTSPMPWAYAASVAIPSADALVPDRHAAVLRVRARTSNASAGVGVLDAAGEHFIDRTCLEPSEAPSDVLLRIPNLADAARFIVQSWAAPESATVHIARIDLLVYGTDSRR